MVHRICVHATAQPENRRKQNNRFSVHHQFLVVIVASAFVYRTSSSHHFYFSKVAIVAGVGLLISLKYFVDDIRNRNQFQKAAIEITSFGVQLVSIYGRNDNSDDPGKAIQSKTAASNVVEDDEINVAAAHNIDDNTHHVHKKFLHNTTSKRQVRAFIPRERIIDVIVMEIVWPHCVWSQVAFRVNKGCESLLVQSKCSKEDSGVGMCRRRRCQEIALPPDDMNNIYDNGNIQSNIENCNDADNQFASASPNIQALMKQNRVAIVPAFPEECRGLLSYKECLLLQEEIEHLLEDTNTR